MSTTRQIVAPSNRLILTEGERASATWNTVSMYLREKIASLDVSNRSDMDQYKTAQVRGQIAILNELLDAEKDDPVVETSNL